MTPAEALAVLDPGPGEEFTERGDAIDVLRNLAEAAELGPEVLRLRAERDEARGRIGPITEQLNRAEAAIAQALALLDGYTPVTGDLNEYGMARLLAQVERVLRGIRAVS